MAVPRAPRSRMWRNHMVALLTEELRFSARITALSPPEVEDPNHQHDHNRDVEALDRPRQTSPLLSKQISRTGNNGHPRDSAQEIKEGKCLPAHAQNTRERTGNHAHTKNEAGKKNGPGTIAGKNRLAALHRTFRNTKEILIAIDQRSE